MRVRRAPSHSVQREGGVNLPLARVDDAAGEGLDASVVDTGSHATLSGCYQHDGNTLIADPARKVSRTELSWRARFAGGGGGVGSSHWRKYVFAATSAFDSRRVREVERADGLWRLLARPRLDGMRVAAQYRRARVEEDAKLRRRRSRAPMEADIGLRARYALFGEH